MCPCLGGHIDAAPTCMTVKTSDDEHFGAHSRSFGTRSPTLRVLCCHSRARLASGRLAGLYREGVEPSGPLRKVSGHMTILLSCPPDATCIVPTCPCTLLYGNTQLCMSGRRGIPASADVCTFLPRPKSSQAKRQTIRLRISNQMIASDSFLAPAHVGGIRTPMYHAL
jgi:hypothetical protein